MIQLLLMLLLVRAEQVFGNQTTNTTNGNPAESSTNKELNCALPDGRAGVCVPYYSCNITDKNRNFYYGESNCTSYVDVCCTREDEIIKQTQHTEDKKFELDEHTEDKKLELVQHIGCGWANPEGVTSGTRGKMTGKSRFGEFPWVVAILNVESLFVDDPESPKVNVYIGAGSLIHPSIALTTASYVTSRKTLKIRAGEWDTRSFDELYPFQDRDVASVQMHKDFNNDKGLNNIAILFVVQPFDLAPNVGVVCLPPPNYLLKDGTHCYGAGWGKEFYAGKKKYHKIQKKVEMPVIKREECQETLRKDLNESEYLLPSSLMCAGGETGKNICWYHGLSTLSCPIESQKDRFIQSGFATLTLRGDCDSGTSPRLYTDVSAMRDWIDDKVKEKDFDPKIYTY